MYNIEYLPKAREDMVDLVRYIGGRLENKEAAEKIANEIMRAVRGVAEFPYSTEAYWPLKRLDHEYRRIVVKNYLVFYWVDEREKTVTVARVIYSKRKYEGVL